MALSLQRYTWSDFNTGVNLLLKQRRCKQRQTSALLAIAIKNGDRLPENLMIEILSWLPVKDLLQFKSVCKSWHALISSPQFISKHLQNNRNIVDNCLLAQYYVTHAELQLFELLLDEHAPRVLASEVLYSMPMYGAYIYGPCDGLYYLYEYDFSGRALWNPAINEIRHLPPIIEKPDPPINTTPAKSEVYGFGVDPLTGDYKVAVIKGYWSTNDEDVSYPLYVMVYSLRTNSWKYCGDLTREYDLASNKCYIFVKGCCFWLGSNSQDGENSREVVVSFDMATDSFQEIPVPDYQQPASKSIVVYNDSLAFISVHDEHKNLDLWTLNEGIWTKKFGIGPFPEVWDAVGHWKDKLILECEGRKLVFCDPKTEEIKELAFQRDMTCQGVFAYMESLVSIKDKNKPDDSDDDEDDEAYADIAHV